MNKLKINSEIYKFTVLGLIFFIIIGIYWFLRPIKDGVFITMVGAEYLPYVKILSVVAVFPIIGFYSKIVDKYSRDKVFYIMVSFFAILMLLFGLILGHSQYGVYSQQMNFIKILVGVLLCIYVKIFGSVMVAIFWSFVSDITTPDSARNGYYIISLGGQLGNILGPLFVGFFAQQLGIVNLSLMASVAIFCLIPIMYLFVSSVPKNLMVGFHGKNERELSKNKLGLVDGFKYLFENPYLISIYLTISIFEIIQAVLDFRFKTLIGSIYTGDQLVEFLGRFGALTGLVAILCVILGSKFVKKYLNFRLTLFILPICLIFLVIFNVYTSLYVAMWVLIITRAINYALNQPSKEQLYITTSKEAKYKAKAWIEIFGTRTSEAFAQTVNLLKVSMGPYFLPFSTVVSLGLIGVWLYLSNFLGVKYKKAQDEDKFIC